MKIGRNFTIFVLFFGVALVEAIRSQNLLLAGLFLALGLMFLRADYKAKK